MTKEIKGAVTCKMKKNISLEFTNDHNYEQWLWNNQTALAQVKQGLKDVAKGRVNYIGSFIHFIDDDFES